MTAPLHTPLDSAVHAEILRVLIDRGFAPTLDELAARLRTPSTEIVASLRRLEANHGVVLHPGSNELWVVHPFSTTPTLFWVAAGERGWWAPCAWCALGVAVLVGEPVRIRTVIGGDGEPCEIRYDHGQVTPADLLVHFPIPVARAWDNVHRHCACTLVFRDRRQIEAWSARHGIAHGEVQPIEKVAELAKVWYGGHLAPDWRKATPAEAAARFRSVGLTSALWQVPDGSRRF